MSGKITYSLNIATANITDAGTDAAVKIQLIGEKGKSPEIELDKPGNDFEQGDFDIYQITIDDIGDLKKVRLFHNNGGMQPGWCLGALSISWSHEESVGVAPKITSQTWWPELGSVTGKVSVKVDGSLFGLPTEVTVNGVWLAKDSGGIDKTFDLKTGGRKEVIIPPVVFGPMG
ncbi:hypothetical protein M1P56_16130 [Streptomyces sp. HU2014]|uniref:PLAT domain-containing protein n=1 Tax=Streptomyces albireticuli TaxID=1940 RepID=A0A1Z2LDR9_9ACTN|nr:MULTISPECIES: PLAT/LH2 domain-containing protein [Streptomyces]ARZ72425.1 hypothetical protein SMD11_6849 [Streptomyces albireticuli]UQI45772.1 hypothetical protein M1P56_16130 [Streptomyces sp. HU2014]